MIGVVVVPIRTAVHSKDVVGGSWYGICGIVRRIRIAVPPAVVKVLSDRRVM